MFHLEPNNKKKFADMSNLTFYILKKRHERNFKQAHIGREIGLSQKQYCRIESGEGILKLQVFLQIADALEVNPCDLLAKAGLLKEFPPSEKSILVEKLLHENSELKKRVKELEDSLFS